MDPLNLPLSWRRNAPEPESFVLTSDDGVTPVDLTALQFLLQVRLYPEAPGSPLVSLSMAAAGQPGFFLDDPANGAFTLTPPTPAVLQQLPLAAEAGNDIALAYDCLIIHPDGATEPFWVGTVTLISTVSIYGA